MQTWTSASSRVMGCRLNVLVRTISGKAAGSWSVGSSSTKSSASLGRDCSSISAVSSLPPQVFSAGCVQTLTHLFLATSCMTAGRPLTWPIVSPPLGPPGPCHLPLAIACIQKQSWDKVGHRGSARK